VKRHRGRWLTQSRTDLTGGQSFGPFLHKQAEDVETRFLSERTKCSDYDRFLHIFNYIELS
jgi:hypothetical protein